MTQSWENVSPGDEPMRCFKSFSAVSLIIISRTSIEKKNNMERLLKINSHYT